MTHNPKTARDMMDPNPAYCSEDLLVEDAIRRLSEEGVSCLLVVDDDHYLLGLITESDLVDRQQQFHLPTAIAMFDMVIPLGVQQFEQELERMQAITVGELAQRDLITTPADADLSTVASLMVDHKIHHLPVMEGDTVIGLISKHDVIRALVDE